MSSARESTSSTGLWVTQAPSAARQPQGEAWSSLPPKPPPSLLDVDLDLVERQAQHPRRRLLHRVRPLGRREDEDAALAVDPGAGPLGLEVDVLLAGDLAHAFDHVRAAGEGPIDVAPLDGARHVDHQAALVRLLGMDHRLELFDLELDQAPGRQDGLLVALGQHQGDRHAAEMHLRVGEKRLVRQHRADLVLARDVGGRAITATTPGAAWAAARSRREDAAVRHRRARRPRRGAFRPAPGRRRRRRVRPRT